MIVIKKNNKLYDLQNNDINKKELNKDHIIVTGDNSYEVYKKQSN